MKKYFYIFKAELLSSLQYVPSILINSVGYFILIFIFYHLWDFIYSNPEELINGYSKTQMIWYFIVTELLWSIFAGKKLCRKISDDVKGGNVAYNMNKPYSYIGYILASHMGSGIMNAVIYIALGAGIGMIFLGALPKLSIMNYLIIVFIGFLAVIINTLFISCIGLISFFIEDSHPLYWLYSKLILILGTMFPIEFFPAGMQKIFSFSPIYVICYGPARMFVSFNYMDALNIILFQLLYIIVAYSLCIVIYTKGVKKLNVNGG